MTPEDLLRGWVTTHGLISMGWTQDFMARPEAKKIVEYRDADIVACVRKHKRLVDILNCLKAEGEKVPARRQAPNLGSPAARQLPRRKVKPWSPFRGTKSPQSKSLRNDREKPKPVSKSKVQNWGSAKEATVNFDAKHRPDYL